MYSYMIFPSNIWLKGIRFLIFSFAIRWLAEYVSFIHQCNLTNLYIVFQVCGLKWSYDNRELASGGNDNRVSFLKLYTAIVAGVAGITYIQLSLYSFLCGTNIRLSLFWSTLSIQQLLKRLLGLPISMDFLHLVAVLLIGVFVTGILLPTHSWDVWTLVVRLASFHFVILVHIFLAFLS